MKTLGWIVFFFVIVLLVWLYVMYPTPMLMGTMSILWFLASDSILKRSENLKKALVFISVIGLILFAGIAFMYPSTIVFVGAVGNGTLTPPNFWHGLVAAFVQYFMLIGGLWSWNNAEISEFLTKQRL